MPMCPPDQRRRAGLILPSNTRGVTTRACNFGRRINPALRTGGHHKLNLQHARILLLGGNGMLGRAWRDVLDERGLHYAAPDSSACNLTKSDTLLSHVTSDTSLVVNCAAWTDVDGAENDEAAATHVNGTGVGVLATLCQQVGAALVHYSTDYVFNGQATSPYAVDALIDPINAYGRGKAEGERLIAESGCTSLVVRTSWLYAPPRMMGNNFVLTMARLLRERDVVQVVDDQRGRPTSAQHLAAATVQLLAHEATGTCHVTDGGECTWYDLAMHIRDEIGASCDVKRCTSDQFPRPAKRPMYSVLDLSKTEAMIGTMTDWRQHVSQVLRDVH